MKVFIQSAFFTLLLLPQLSAFSADSNLEGIKFFETNIRPLLIEKCMTCHKAGKAMSGFQLDSREGIVKGGKRGSSINLDEPHESLLLKAITHQDETLKMPPGKKLADEEIQLIAEWVQIGAPWTVAKSNGESNEFQREFTQEERDFWLFQPIQNPKVPDVNDRGWSKNPIDKFVYQKLDEAGLQPADEAEKRVLIRRAYYDLTGLPPTPREVQDFISDDSPDAYETLIDRLLASPRYGEKWARHWMDLARYAESDGYKADHYRPHAWRYRDYVIQSFNEDKPYNQFVMEQLAGDEIAPNDPEAMIATGFLRLGIYEYNQRDARTQWEVILNDLTDVTGDVFLGMSVSCARCHDHKFDPVLQKDYYRLRAFYEPILLRNDLPPVSSQEWQKYQAKLAVWEAKTEDIRKQIAAIEQPKYDKAAKDILETFPEDVKEMIFKPAQDRTPYEHQLAMLAEFQAIDKGTIAVSAIKNEDRKKLDGLYKQLKQFDEWKPTPLPEAMTVRDVGPFPPATVIKDDPTNTPIEPGIISILNAEPMKIEAVPSAPNSTGQRTALAQWITNPNNRITNRVLVNRIWQFHFGEGIVETSSEFGNLGELPTHPELLDWLAVQFVENGWSLKKMHRLIMTSAAYRQSSRRPMADVAMLKDPQNRLLWRFHSRRLEAEEIRDSMLSVSGELKHSEGGKSNDWNSPHRSVYTKVYRNQFNDILAAFDAPDGITSSAKRNVTTTPLQSLFLLNSKWTMQRAHALLERVESTYPQTTEEWVNAAYRTILTREPSQQEITDAVEFLHQHTDLIESTFTEESEMIARSVRDYVVNELDDSVRIKTVTLLQSKIEEFSKPDPGSENQKTLVLVGGEGGPKLREKEIQSISGGDEFYHPSELSYSQRAALTDFCHILLNTSEFLYLE